MTANQGSCSRCESKIKDLEPRSLEEVRKNWTKFLERGCKILRAPVSKAIQVATKSELEAAGALAGMKEKKSTRKSRVGKAFDDDDDIVLDVDLSMFPISVPKASVPSKETETKVAAPPLQHKAKPLKEKIVDTIAKEIKASTSKVTKPGKHVVVHLPRMRFFDCGDASFRFLMELEKTTGAPWEIYREPPLIFRVKPYSADSELSPSLERYNEAYGTNLRQELIAVHVPGSGEDDNRYNLPLLWGAKDGMRGVDRAAKEVFKMSEGVVGEVGGQGEREEGEVIPTRGLGKSTVPFEVDYEDKSFNPESKRLLLSLFCLYLISTLLCFDVPFF